MKTILLSFILGLIHISPAALANTVCTAGGVPLYAQLEIFGAPQEYKITLSGRLHPSPMTATYETVKVIYGQVATTHEIAKSDHHQNSQALPETLFLTVNGPQKFTLEGLVRSFHFTECEYVHPCGKGMKYDAAYGECVPD